MQQRDDDVRATSGQPQGNIATTRTHTSGRAACDIEAHFRFGWIVRCIRGMHHLDDRAGVGRRERDEIRVVRIRADGELRCDACVRGTHARQTLFEATGDIGRRALRRHVHQWDRRIAGGQAVTAVMTTVAEAGRRSLFMVRSSAFPIMRENMVRGRSVTRFNLKWRCDVMLRDETVIHLQATCKHGGKRSGQSQYTHHLSARSLPDSLSAITMRHRDRCIERVKRMKKPAP
jgi:hypothetical protein